MTTVADPTRPLASLGIRGLGVLCTASFLAVADTTLVAIRLPELRADLAMDVGTSAWVLTGYSVTFGGLLLLCGRLGDLFGRLRMFRLGLALFAAASLVAALSWHPAVLVTMRLAQGAGAAAFVPASLALLNASASDDRTRHADCEDEAAPRYAGLPAGERAHRERPDTS